MTFDDLFKKRRAYVESARENGFEEGLMRLLADLYPDNAHFIYELLQNAEDAGAHKVTFVLRDDGLFVNHDGKRLFDLRDIESITGIGQSTKSDDETSIGKFGVGFKAVYAYTQTPSVDSGEHAFAIEDMFVPVNRPSTPDNKGTTFWFPFDRADKPAGRAAEEVGQALRDLSRTTLLFLANIRSILLVLPDGESRTIERRTVGGRLVAIDSDHDHHGASYWYRISGDVRVQDKLYPVAAAFALEPRASKNGEPKRYSVKPIDGNVFIYFPAMKETSGLKFHIHAPFASTVARDSVRDDPGNDALVAGIAKLVSETLPDMRDSGLITDGLLGALPNNNDELSPRYAPLRQHVVDAFTSHALTPMIGGGHAPSAKLIRTDRSIRTALSVEDANTIRGFRTDVPATTGTGWLPEREGRALSFLNSLPALPLRLPELSIALDRVAIDPVATRWHEWITTKDDDWLRRFYRALESLVPKTRTFLGYEPRREVNAFNRALRTAPLFRVRSGDGIRHVDGAHAFLPPAPGLCTDGLLVDALAVFEGSDKSVEEELAALYNRAGLAKWDAVAELNARFDNYTRLPPEVTDAHLNDLGTLARLLKEDAVSLRDYQSRPILLAVQPDGSRFWTSLETAFLDEPFAPSGLAALYESEQYRAAVRAYQRSNRVPLAPEYAQINANFIALAREFGVAENITIAEVSSKENPHFDRKWTHGKRETEYTVARDWTIRDFDLIVSTGDEPLLRNLWHTVADQSSDDHTQAQYKANRSSAEHFMTSRLLQLIQSRPWVLDRDGNLRNCADVTEHELAEGLTPPKNSPLLAAAGFGHDALKSSQRVEIEDEIAKSNGFVSREQMKQLGDLFRKDPGLVDRLIKESEQHSEPPDSPSRNPATRAAHASTRATLAVPPRFENRIRSIRVSEPGFRSAAKTYLREMYTNDRDVLICQICTRAMPFQVNGEYFFEAVQFVRDAKRDLRENRLALCPTCAAKYRYALDTSPVELREDLLTQTVREQGSILVDLAIAGERSKIRFVGKHAIDLQAALEATEGVTFLDTTMDRFDTDDEIGA